MQELQVVGAGVGPANVSVAALLEPVGLSSLFFERQSDFSWHPGMLFPEATIQNFFLKDLVTLAAPTSPYSFLAFLFAKRRLYRYLSAGMPTIKRAEFEQYYRWVAESLPNLRFNRTIESVDHDGGRFVVELGDGSVGARHLILGTGLEPKIPSFARRHLGPTVFHSSRFLSQCKKPAGLRIAIVGGGQSGAEILQHLLRDTERLPAKIHWITRRPNLLPLDDSPFVEEIFTPAYSDYFFNLSEPQRERLLTIHRMASDGISIRLLRSIYRRLYDLEFNEAVGRPWRLFPESEVASFGGEAGTWRLGVREVQTGTTHSLEVDLVILATGFEYRMPAFLDPIRDRIPQENGQLIFREDFSIAWEGEEQGKIFVQNAARHRRGLPDPNLSLMAWRSAKIVNALAGRQVYDVTEPSSVFDWPGQDEETDVKSAALESLAGQKL